MINHFLVLLYIETALFLMVVISIVKLHINYPNGKR